MITAVSSSIMLAGCASEPATGDALAVPVNTDPISMPASVGDMESYDRVCAVLTEEDAADRCRESAESDATVKQAAAANMETAYGGGPAASQTYTEAEFLTILTTFAVRASSPRLWSYQDSDEFNQRMNVTLMETVVRDGVAECLVRPKNGVIAPYGESYTDDDLVTSECQATGDGLTVLVFGGYGLSVDEMLDFTRELYRNLGGQ